MNPKQELLWGLWVGWVQASVEALCFLARCFPGPLASSLWFRLNIGALIIGIGFLMPVIL